MKWFFAINEAALRSQRELWEPMMRVAVESARATTNLEPNLIVYGVGDDPFLEELRRRGVRIIPHKLSYLASLETFYGEGSHVASIASGAFLRTEIPLLEYEDDVVLYTDCDVMFERQPFLQLSASAPFACAPESDRADYDNLNTGVMLMNLPVLRQSLTAFTDWIKANLDQCAAFDQGAYQLYYRGQWDRLPLKFNWKPYWGSSDEASIIHFHGPKPLWARTILEDPEWDQVPIYRALVNSNPTAYRLFLERWDAWLAKAELATP